jgi:tRNA1Val (adenine37-N6)-methyltransferase
MPVFKFKKFTIHQDSTALKVGTDAMVFGALIESVGHKHCLDIGTGTGVLSLMVAQKNPCLSVTAIEIDECAIEDATLNFKNTAFKNSFHLIKNDYFLHVFNQKFDLIISNPPFFNDSFPSPEHGRKVARNFNANFVDNFFFKSSDLISEEGRLWIILPHDQLEFWDMMASKHGFKLVKKRLIFGKPKKLIRSICVYSKKSTVLNYMEEDFCIRNMDGNYTQEYIELTSDFHDRIPIK